MRLKRETPSRALLIRRVRPSCPRETTSVQRERDRVQKVRQVNMAVCVRTDDLLAAILDSNEDGLVSFTFDGMLQIGAAERNAYMDPVTRRS
jgi:hypothetical protein